MKNGAVVHGARDEVELQRLVDRLGVEVAVVDRMAIEIVLAAVEARQDRPQLELTCRIHLGEVEVVPCQFDLDPLVDIHFC